MKKRRTKTFRDLIRVVGPDTAPPDFTQVIMNEILADVQGQAVTNPELKLLIQKAPIENPSAAFTYNAMKKIKLADNTAENEPIIGKKPWFIAASTVILSVLFVILTNTPEDTAPITPVLSNVLHHLYTFVRKVPYVYVLTLAGASTLLLIDYFLSERFVRVGRSGYQA